MGEQASPTMSGRSTVRSVSTRNAAQSDGQQDAKCETGDALLGKVGRVPGIGGGSYGGFLVRSSQ